MFNLLEKFKEEGKKVIEFFKNDIQTLRTNRATPDLVANVLVNAYGVKTPLKQLANITAPEPRLLVIQPWDTNIIKEIESALANFDLGATPTVKENVIHINLPPLNEETRKKLVKILSLKVENSRVSLRRVRDEVRSKIIESTRNGELTEDDKYRLLEELDKETDKFMKEIEEIQNKKEREITSI
ncbi:ribosome recycling factor [bacterium]|nr:ribosome recycling factor [bacterium]